MTLPIITDHAQARYMQLSGVHRTRNVFTKAGNLKTPDRILKAIWTDIANSEQVQLKKKFRTKQLLNHKLRPATYLRNKRGWITITTSSPSTTARRRGGSEGNPHQP